MKKKIFTLLIILLVIAGGIYYFCLVKKYNDHIHKQANSLVEVDLISLYKFSQKNSAIIPNASNSIETQQYLSKAFKKAKKVYLFSIDNDHTMYGTLDVNSRKSLDKIFVNRKIDGDKNIIKGQDYGIFYTITYTNSKFVIALNKNNIPANNDIISDLLKDNNTVTVENSKFREVLTLGGDINYLENENNKGFITLNDKIINFKFTNSLDSLDSSIKYITKQTNLDNLATIDIDTILPQTSRSFIAINNNPIQLSIHLKNTDILARALASENISDTTTLNSIKAIDIDAEFTNETIAKIDTIVSSVTDEETFEVKEIKEIKTVNHPVVNIWLTNADSILSNKLVKATTDTVEYKIGNELYYKKLDNNILALNNKAIPSNSNSAVTRNDFFFTHIYFPYVIKNKDLIPNASNYKNAFDIMSKLNTLDISLMKKKKNTIVTEGSLSLL